MKHGEEIGAQSQNCSIGIDIGGTKICAGIVDADKKIIARVSFPTDAKQGPDTVTEHIIANVKDLIAQSTLSSEDIRSIGCCIPGTVDPHSGFVQLAPNIGWVNYEFGSTFAQAFQGIPIRYEQDTKAAAYGEFLLLNDTTMRSLFYITISTGIGAGIVIDGKIVRGFHFAAGEIGHCAIDRNGAHCTCGNDGCLQAYSRGPAIVETVKKALRNGEPSTLTSKKPLDLLDAMDVTSAALEGDALCRDILEKAADDVGYALSWAVNILDPDIIIVGGGIAKSGSFFFQHLEKATRKYSYPPLRDIPIQVSNHWEASNVIGVAALSCIHE